MSDVFSNRLAHLGIRCHLPYDLKDLNEVKILDSMSAPHENSRKPIFFQIYIIT